MYSYSRWTLHFHWRDCFLVSSPAKGLQVRCNPLNWRGKIFLLDSFNIMPACLKWRDEEKRRASQKGTVTLLCVFARVINFYYIDDRSDNMVVIPLPLHTTLARIMLQRRVCPSERISDQIVSSYWHLFYCFRQDVPRLIWSWVKSTQHQRSIKIDPLSILIYGQKQTSNNTNSTCYITTKIPWSSNIVMYFKVKFMFEILQCFYDRNSVTQRTPGLTRKRARKHYSNTFNIFIINVLHISRSQLE